MNKLPKVYLVGRSTINWDGFMGYLRGTDQVEFLGDVDYAETQLISQAEILCSFYAKSCYSALTTKKNDNISRVRSIKENIIGTIKSGHGSVFEHAQYNFMITDCSRVFTHELVRHRVGTAFCLSGDTEVWSGTKINGRWDGVRKKWTMEQLYNWSRDYKRKGKLKLIKIRCLSNGEFVPARIKNVIQSGEKEVFEVKLANGKFIKCSIDHRFLTKDGWKPLRELKIGECLTINGVIQGRASTEEKENARKLAISQSQTGERSSRWAGDDVGLSGARRRARKFKGDQCEDCGSEEQLHVHHKDRDVLNNNPENLQTLCSSCHSKLHLREDGNPNSLLPKLSEIIEIKPKGVEMTYDLEVDHPEHNFVANGIVTHNSQTSGRYVRGENIDFVHDPILDDCTEEINGCISDITKWYKKILDKKFADENTMDFALKKKITSAMRRILPNGQTNEIGFSANLRALRHTITMRSSRHAEWEIRYIYNQIAKIMKDECPVFFQDLVDNGEFDGITEWVFENGSI